MELAHELEHWHDFYVLVGTAGATLVALLFVAVSLGVGFLTEARAAATRVFYSPIIVHFAAVFFVSAISLIPEHGSTFFAALIGGTAVCGIGVSTFTTIQLLRHHWTDYLQDHIGYGLLPLAAYVALVAAAVMIFTQHAEALDVLAGALLLLLVVNIRNAWDLTLSMVRRHSSGPIDS
jgi:hypothetical protein